MSVNTHRTVGEPEVMLNDGQLVHHLGDGRDGDPDQAQTSHREVQLRDRQADADQQHKHKVYRRHLERIKICCIYYLT